MSKIIGIVGTVLGDKPRLGTNQEYIDWAHQFGCPVVIDPRAPFNSKIDLLVLPGGADCLPTRYGQAPDPGRCNLPNYWLEYFDLVVLPKYVESKTPIYGICRGLQTLNIFFGGTLHQHVDEPTSDNYNELVHHINLNSSHKTALIQTNSYHHQVVDKLAKDFYVTATGELHTPQKNGPPQIQMLHIEGMRHKTLPIVAHQFHPERLFANSVGAACLKFVNDEIESILC